MISILLPVLNEEQNVALITYFLFSYLKNIDFELIILDDSSKDRTFEIAQKLQAHYGSDNIILIKRNGRGIGSAYKEMVKKAKGEFIVIMDSDLSHHPKSIIDMIEMQKSKDFDIVSGSRYIKNGGIHGWNLKRKLVSTVANLLTKIALGTRCSDITGSFRIYKSSVFKSLASSVKADGFNFQMEIMARAEKKGYSIGEVPIVFVDRIYGQSKISFDEIIKFAFAIFSLIFEI